MHGNQFSMQLIPGMNCRPSTGNTEREITLTERKVKAVAIAPPLPAISKVKSTVFKVFIQHVPLVEVTLLALAFTAFLLIVPKINLAAMSASVADAPAVGAFSKLIPPEDASVEVDPEGFVDEFRTSTEIEFAQGLYEDAERAFYTQLAKGNFRIVQAIYEYGIGINKDLIFAQIEKESRFFPRAINENIDQETGVISSIDRGLFQLNSRSYPDLKEEEFFNIEINVRYGIAHLRGELEFHKGNTRRALWSYNAGRYGISDGVPSRTLVYAAEILARTKQIASERDAYIKAKLVEYRVYSPATSSTALASVRAIH